MARSPGVTSPPNSFPAGNEVLGQLEISVLEAAGLMRPASFLMILTRLGYGQAIAVERQPHGQKWAEHCHIV